MSNKGLLLRLAQGKHFQVCKKNIKRCKYFSINSITDIKNLKMNFKGKKILITGATGGMEIVS